MEQNAISFAMNGNIALSMEIGSAYALQVCLLQIPCLVLFSAVHGRFISDKDIIDHTFSKHSTLPLHLPTSASIQKTVKLTYATALIFPQWDMVTVILCVFLLSYMYGEGKSNYFKGSILILSYLVVIVGFYFSSFDNVSEMVLHGVNPSDRLALGPRVGTLGGAGGIKMGRGGEL